MTLQSTILFWGKNSAGLSTKECPLTLLNALCSSIGLAKSSGRFYRTDTIEKMQKRVEIDLDYINNWSLWLDIKIMIKTPLTLISKDIY